MQQKTNDNKRRYNKIRNLLQKKNGRIFYQKFLVTNAKLTSKTFFDTIKNLGGDTQKQ